MAKILVETSKEEQEKVLKVLKNLQGQTAPVSTIATMAGMGPSRVRYVLIDLVESGRVKRIPTKAFNKHYVRYSYEVVKA